MENASDGIERHWALRYKSRKGNAGYAWLVNYCNCESGKSPRPSTGIQFSS